MAKIETDIVKKVLERNVTAVRERNQVLEDIKKVLEEEAMDKDTKPPALKKEYVIIVSDPKGVLKDAYPDGVAGLVVMIPEGENTALALDKITTAAYEHNASPRGRKFPVETIGEACESVAPKVFKEHNVWVKTKMPVLVVRTDNKLPRNPGSPD